MISVLPICTCMWVPPITQISNALVRICTRSLLNYCTRQDDKDMFWDILFSTVQAQIKSGPSQIDHPFLTHLSLCLQVTITHTFGRNFNSCHFAIFQVAAVFKETLHQLKDVLVTQRHTSFSTPLHSVGHSSASLSDTRRGSDTPTKPLLGGGKRKGSESTTEKKMSTSSTSASRSNTSACISGVALHNVDQIAASMDEMSSRVTKIIDIVSTLSAFHNLVGNMRGLPRISGLWVATSTAKDSLGDANEREVPIEGSVTTSDYLEQLFGQKGYPLKEEEHQKPPPPSPSSPPSSPSSPSDSIAQHIHSSLVSISTSLSTSCDRGVHDIFCISGRARLVFPTAHEVYSTQVVTLEKDISNYLKVSTQLILLQLHIHVMQFLLFTDCGFKSSLVQNCIGLNCQVCRYVYTCIGKNS